MGADRGALDYSTVGGASLIGCSVGKNEYGAVVIGLVLLESVFDVADRIGNVGLAPDAEDFSS